MFGWLARWQILVVLQGPGATSGEALALSWEVRGPEGCDDALLRRQVAALLAETNEAPAEDLHVSVTLGPRADEGWVIDLRMEDSSGASERHFEAARCETVVEAAALVVAMKIDPNVLGTAPPVDPGSGAEPEFPTPEAPAAHPAPVPGSQHREPIGAGIRVQGGVAALALPGATGQVGAVVFVSGRHWRAGLGGRYRFGTHAALPDLDAGGRFSLGAGQVVGCGLLGRRSIEFPLCGAVELGSIVARGYGVRQVEQSRRPWLALRLQPGVAYVPRPWVSIGLALDVGLVASRERYFLEGLGDVHTVGPVELGALIFVEFRLVGRSS